MLRVPSRIAAIAPLIGAPPAATTPTRANWDAPVKTSSDRAQVCRTLSPAATPTAPKLMP